jgi:hypothetical protein
MANPDAFLAGLNKGGAAASKQPGSSAKKRKDVGPVTSSSGQTYTPSAPMNFKKGGKVRKTGVAKVHKGEYVLTAAQAREFKSSHKTRRKKTGARKLAQSKR